VWLSFDVESVHLINEECKVLDTKYTLTDVEFGSGFTFIYGDAEVEFVDRNRTEEDKNRTEEDRNRTEEDRNRTEEDRNRTGEIHDN